MSTIAILLVGIGAACGGAVRFLITNYYKRHTKSRFPGATLFLNLTGAFALGYLTSLTMIAPSYHLLLGTGFLGGYTTFSTYNTELLVLWRDQKWGMFLTYFFVSYIVGLGLAWLGLMLGRL